MGRPAAGIGTEGQIVLQQQEERQRDDQQQQEEEQEGRYTYVPDQYNFYFNLEQYFIIEKKQ